MSKGRKEMIPVITKNLNVGDKFKLPDNRFEVYEVIKIKDNYIIYKNINSNEEFSMVRGMNQKVNLIDESADYQKKRFKEPYYMYEDKLTFIDKVKVGDKIEWNGKELKIIQKNSDIARGMDKDGNVTTFYLLKMHDPITIKEAVEKKSDYLAIISRFRKDINKEIDKIEKTVEKGKPVEGYDRSEATVLATRFDAEMLRYNLAVQNKVLTEGFMVKEKSGNTYIGRFDSKDKAEKAVKDLAKKYGKSEANWLVEPDDKYMAAATAKGASSWGPIPMNTLTESFIIQDSDSNDKPVYFHYGKYTGYDWGFDKKMATKFSTKEAAERMIEKMRQEGMLINSMKVVSESLSSKTHKFKPEELKVGKRVIDKVGGHEVHGKITVNHHDLYKDNPYTQDKKGSTVVTITTDKGRSYDVDANDNGGEFILESRIAKGYENLNAEERAKHLLSHPSSKYMNDLKSENITERAIRKAVKEMLGKPAKDDPQFIIDVNEGCIKESVYYIKSPSGFYVMKTDNSYDLTDDKEKALKYTISNDAAKELSYIHRYSPDSRLKKLMVVQEEGEAPAIANTTANVANPELPLKLKESVGQKLNISLVRKAQNLKEVEKAIRKGEADRVKAIVDKSYKLSADEYDKFVYNFMAHTTYLSGEGGVDSDGTVHVVEITAPGKKTIYVDPEGYDYARYVGW